ncbi:MAG: ribosome-associated translation inhibitor RaiA [Pseudomonadota bacterium]|jgi:ribosomal subunit interface protein|nr:ribosome-associated translation inhibitor RaiA [Pseudomonadota bacterium]
MALRVSGKNIDIGESLKTQAQARVAGVLGKYFDGSYTGHVTVSRDGTGFRTDCVLHLSSGITLEASGAAGDAYASFDQTADRIERRLRRYRRRLKDRPVGARDRREDATEAALESIYAVIEPPSDEALEEEGEYHPVVIAEDTRALHRLSVSEAVLDLDLTGAAFVVFLHASTGRVNVVYRRRDGAIGWIDPPAGQAASAVASSPNPGKNTIGWNDPPARQA